MWSIQGLARRVGYGGSAPWSIGPTRETVRLGLDGEALHVFTICNYIKVFLMPESIGIPRRLLVTSRSMVSRLNM